MCHIALLCPILGIVVSPSLLQTSAWNAGAAAALANETTLLSHAQLTHLTLPP